MNKVFIKIIISMNKNMMKMFEMIFIFTMFIAWQEKNCVYAIIGFVIYCICDIFISKRSEKYYNSKKRNKITIADDFDRSRLREYPESDN